MTEEYSTLHSRMEELLNHNEFLSADHERLTYDYLKRKQELEALREAHEDLMKIILFSPNNLKRNLKYLSHHV